MRFGWKTERKHTPTKVESAFERMLLIDGYKVRAYKECWGKTDYRIEKNGVSSEYSVPSDAKNAYAVFDIFEQYYRQKAELLKLRAECDTKGIAR